MLRRCPPWVLSAALAIAYLCIDPPSADLAAQQYRTALFDHAGLVIWDNAWYGGHHMWGYSVLFPALGGWLGPRVVGALAAVAAAWLFERITFEHWGDQARMAAWWFSAATAVNLLTGRLTFALGVAFGLAAILAASHRRPALAALAGAASTLASPIAGLFIAMGCAGWFIAGPRRRDAVTLGLAAAVPAFLLAGLFPEGGVEPFVPSSFWPAMVSLAVVVAVLPRGERVLRITVVLYMLATVASYVLETPMGGNVTRLGAIAAGPVLACVLWPRHRTILLVVALPLLYWQWNAPVRDWRRASGDPSVHAQYYSGVVDYLQSRAAGRPPFRVEVPFTENHWESRWVAPHFPLARGWERQLDIGRNGLFYDKTLAAARYRRWLDENAVAFVALPDVPLDHSAINEGTLLRSGRSGLTQVWRDAHWRVFEVPHPTPMATGGTLTALTTDSFTVRLPPGGGEARVRIRWTRWWHVRRGDATIVEGPKDWTTVRGRGDVTVGTRILG